MVLGAPEGRGLGTERAGLVRREMVGAHASYTLTESGRELNDIVMALGVWGTRWIGGLGEEDLDPHLLMWDMKRTVPADEWPRMRTVVGFRFDDVPARVGAWWIVTSLRALTQIWRGDRSWEQALGDGSLVVEAPSEVRRALPHWVGQGTFAAVPR
ncbi:MAG: winged helix-turn-helix transcriptional regulator [Marmoricola sp.]